MKRSIVVVALCVSSLVRAGPSSGWSTEYQPPTTATNVGNAGDALARRLWPDAPFRLLEWIRQGMRRPGAMPMMDPTQPTMDARHLRPLLGDPRTRECYWHYALGATLLGLASIAPTPTAAMEFERLAQMARANIPDHCRGGPGGTLARQAWSEETVRYHDVLGQAGYQRLVGAARAHINVRSAGEALGRCTDMGCVEWTAGDVAPTQAQLQVAALLMALAMFPPSAPADLPLLVPLFGRLATP